MSAEAAAVLIALEVASELGLLYFRLLDTAGLSPEEKEAHYQATRVKYYLSIGKPVPELPKDFSPR